MDFSICSNAFLTLKKNLYLTIGLLAIQEADDASPSVPVPTPTLIQPFPVDDILDLNPANNGRCKGCRCLISLNRGRRNHKSQEM